MRRRSPKFFCDDFVCTCGNLKAFDSSKGLWVCISCDNWRIERMNKIKVINYDDGHYSKS